MSSEIMTCPLSACFLGMSKAQAEVAQTLGLSSLAYPAFDRKTAYDAYESLRGPDETADREPTFLDRMLRRVGRSPLSRKGAEAAADALLDVLVAAEALPTRPTLTIDRDEAFHGNLDPIGMLALRSLLIHPGFDAMDRAARIAHVRTVPTPITFSTSPARAAAVGARFPNLCLGGETAVYLPAPMLRVVHGEPHDIGSTVGLADEIAAVAEALALDRAATDALAADDPLACVATNLASLASALDVAHAHGRVLVRSW